MIFRLHIPVRMKHVIWMYHIGKFVPILLEMSNTHLFWNHNMTYWVCVPIYIISHKTRIPYLGPKRDLHAAAREWLQMHNFLDPKGLDWNKDQIFFELTKQRKVERIIETGCTHYVDDLIEILELLPDSIHKILFSPNGSPKVQDRHWSLLNSWKALPELL